MYGQSRAKSYPGTKNSLLQGLLRSGRRGTSHWSGRSNHEGTSWFEKSQVCAWRLNVPPGLVRPVVAAFLRYGLERASIIVRFPKLPCCTTNDSRFAQGRLNHALVVFSHVFFRVRGSPRRQRTAHSQRSAKHSELSRIDSWIKRCDSFTSSVCCNLSLDSIHLGLPRHAFHQTFSAEPLLAPVLFSVIWVCCIS